jgi:WD40 repeat protein
VTALTLDSCFNIRFETAEAKIISGMSVARDAHMTTTLLGNRRVLRVALMFTALAILAAGLYQARASTSPHVNLITTVRAHDARLVALEWSPDGRLLASLGEDRRIRFWNERGEESAAQIELPFTAEAIYWSPDNQRIAAIAKEMAGVFRLNSKEVVRLTGHVGDITSFSWSSDARTILTSSEDRTSKLWDSSTGKTILTIIPGGSQRKQTKSLLKALFTRVVLFDSDSTQASFATDQTILTASMSAFSNKFPKLWDATGRKLATLRSSESDSKPDFVAMTPDRRIVVTSGFDGAHLWDPSTGTLITTLEEVTGSVSFSPDGKKILANSCLKRSSLRCEQHAAIWDLATGKRIMTFDPPTDAYIGLGWSGDATKVVTSVRHKHASVWDANSGRLITTVALVKDRAWVTDYEDDLMLSRRGQVLFAVTDKYVRFWNASTGELILEHESLKKGAWLPFSVHSHGHVAAAADGKTGKLWFWSIEE